MDLWQLSLLVFLAADTRTADPNSMFIFHEYDWTYSQPTTLLESRMVEHLASLQQVVGRARAIVADRTSFPGGSRKVQSLFKRSSTVNAVDALKVGIVQSVEELRLPVGMQIYNVTA